MKRLCDLYIRHAGLVGALYCAVPTGLWFVGMFGLLPFRGVYVLRAVLSLTVGSGVGFYLNRFGLSLWLAKHRSEHGPATSVDGMLVGAAIGFGIALLPALTSLIGTNHLEEAKSFIILSWIGAAANGACFGAVLGAIGRRHIRWGGSGIQEE